MICVNVVSFFAGCGGLDLGFKQAGFNVISLKNYKSDSYTQLRAHE
ncbi:MAG: DNA cytosine methyltransferase, partial [Muribaculaceae bacterium]|nr:DNA cytosine methyltransferase [Muribaculaceae bacterium]